MSKHKIQKINSILYLFFFLCVISYANSPDDSAPTPFPVLIAGFDLSETPIPESGDEPAPTSPLDSQMRGDVNLDKKINIIDGLLIAQYYVGLYPEDFKNPAGADVNGDKKIDIIDALIVAQYYVGILIEL